METDPSRTFKQISQEKERGIRMKCTDSIANIKKIKWLCTLIVLVILEVCALWCIDISVSAMLNNNIVTNGFVSHNPVVTYHIGLLLSFVVLMLICFICVYHIMGNSDN